LKQFNSFTLEISRRARQIRVPFDWVQIIWLP